MSLVRSLWKLVGVQGVLPAAPASEEASWNFRRVCREELWKDDLFECSFPRGGQERWSDLTAEHFREPPPLGSGGVFFQNVWGVGLQGPPYLKLGPLLTRSRIAGLGTSITFKILCSLSACFPVLNAP